jgi:hypothetical protein
MTLISFLVLLGVSWLGLYAVLGSEKQLTIFTRKKKKKKKKNRGKYIVLISV